MDRYGKRIRRSHTETKRKEIDFCIKELFFENYLFTCFITLAFNRSPLTCIHKYINQLYQIILLEK